MQPQEYENLAKHEDSMWWYQGLHGNLLWLLRMASTDPRGVLLDAGCGTGGMLARIRDAFPDMALYGVDIYSQAAAAAAAKSGARVVQASVDTLPFADGCFSAIVSADVLYHRWVDPRAAVREAFRCLRPGGLIVINVPAYAWMRSEHDEAVGGAIRFSRRGVQDLLEEAAFEVRFISYWNCLLFPLMVIRRLLYSSSQGGSDVRRYPPLLDQFFKGVLMLERFLMRAGLRFPFGGSILGVGVKHDQ